MSESPSSPPWRSSTGPDVCARGDGKSGVVLSLTDDVGMVVLIGIGNDGEGGLETAEGEVPAETAETGPPAPPDARRSCVDSGEGPPYLRVAPSPLGTAADGRLETGLGFGEVNVSFASPALLPWLLPPSVLMHSDPLSSYEVGSVVPDTLEETES